MLVVYLNALASIYRLNFSKNIVLNVLTSFGTKNIVRIDRTFGKCVTCHNRTTLTDIGLEFCGVRYGIRFFFFVFALNDDVTLSVFFDNGNCAAVFYDYSYALGLTSFEQFFDSRKTSGYIFGSCDTAGVERSHGKLSTRLAYRLSCDDTNCLANTYRRRT